MNLLYQLLPKDPSEDEGLPEDVELPEDGESIDKDNDIESVSMNISEPNYSSLTKTELQSLLDDKGIEWSGSMNKSQLISLLEGSDY